MVIEDYSQFSFFPVNNSEKKIAETFKEIPAKYYKGILSLFKKDFTDPNTKADFINAITFEEYTSLGEDKRIIGLDYEKLDEIGEDELKQRIFARMEFDIAYFRDWFRYKIQQNFSADKELFINSFLNEFKYDVIQIKSLQKKPKQKTQKVLLQYYLELYKERWQELYDTYKHFSNTLQSFSAEINSLFKNIETVNIFESNPQHENTIAYILMELIATGKLTFDTDRWFYNRKKFNATQFSKLDIGSTQKLYPAYLRATQTESEDATKNIFRYSPANKLRHIYLVTKLQQQNIPIADFYWEKSHKLH